MKKLILILIITILITTPVIAKEIIYPTTIGSIAASAHISGQGSISGLKEGEEARFQTITFPQTDFQTVKVIKEELYINGKTLYPKYILDEFGNKYVLFTITENGDFKYEITADVNRKAMAFDITDYNITTPTESVATFIKPSTKVENNSTEILTLTNNKIFGESYISSINQTIDWVNNYVEYATGDDFRKYYLLQNSAIETLIAKKGVCDEFAALGAAILRAKKIPTRIAVGITYDGLEWGNHAWIETYHEKIKKWIPSDPTFREAGFVDAMHLKMGSFDDITSSNAKCFYPSTAKCNIDVQADLPQVEIINKEYMNNVNLNTNADQLTANKWNDVNLSITNKTTSIISVPVKVRDIKDVLIENKKQSIILNPGETKTMTFNILPKINLQTTQIAKGTLVFNSLTQPYEKEITVNPNENTQNGDLIVDDITPIAHEGTLKIQITATNYFETEKEIQIQIKGQNYKNDENTTIPPLSTKTITTEIQNYTNDPYDINVTTKTKIFLLQIIPTKTKLTAVQEPKQTIIEQKIDQPTTPKNVGESAIGNPISILIGLLAGIIVILFGLFLVNKRYV